MASAHAFVADLESPELDELDRHHLTKALRLRLSEPMTVSDGRGGLRAVRFGPVLEPDGEIEFRPRAIPAITIAMAPVKGQRPEWAVQKLTELGVDRICFIETDRSVVRWNDSKVARQGERLSRVCREAAMQSRQAWLPQLDLGVSFDALSSQSGCALAQMGGTQMTLATPTVLIGPEGGWSPSELSSDLQLVNVGEHVLRAETAAVTAAALLTFFRNFAEDDIELPG